jgi:hypothetical protein
VNVKFMVILLGIFSIMITIMIEKEVEYLEQQALKLRFIQELNEAAEKKNKEIDLRKKNNETNLETEQNVMQDKAAIRLYSKAKIDEIIHILQNPPKTKDHLTKFCHLRPCTTTGAVEEANHLYHIFCEFGAPIILHSDNGLEFRNQVVSSLKIIWPGLQIVHGRSRTPTTQGSVERSNSDFQGMLWINKPKC